MARMTSVPPTSAITGPATGRESRQAGGINHWYCGHPRVEDRYEGPLRNRLQNLQPVAERVEGGRAASSLGPAISEGPMGFGPDRGPRYLPITSDGLQPFGCRDGGP